MALRVALQGMPGRRRRTGRRGDRVGGPRWDFPGGHTPGATRVTRCAPRRKEPEPFERWVAAGGEDAVFAAARRVQDLLAGHEPPDDLDTVTRRQLDAYCLG